MVFILIVVPCNSFLLTTIFSADFSTRHPISASTSVNRLSPCTLSGLSPVTATSPPATAAAATATNSLGGNGAAGNATPPTAAEGGSVYYKYAAQAVKGFNITASMAQPAYLQGGSGGASGEGAGGGVVVIAARYLACSGASQIAATGGTNAGGGVIIFISTDSVLNSNITLNVQGNGTGTAGTANYIEVD